LSFPLEDLYLDGSQNGQVGQEVYGGGAAFNLASQSLHRIAGAPFELFCDSFVFGWERPTARSALLKLAGSPDNEAMLMLIPGKRRRIGGVSLTLADGRRRKGRREGDTLAFTVPADASLTLTW
jgi:hypothetical protein